MGTESMLGENAASRLHQYMLDVLQQGFTIHRSEDLRTYFRTYFGSLQNICYTFSQCDSLVTAHRIWLSRAYFSCVSRAPVSTDCAVRYICQICHSVLIWEQWLLMEPFNVR